MWLIVTNEAMNPNYMQEHKIECFNYLITFCMYLKYLCEKFIYYSLKTQCESERRQFRFANKLFIVKCHRNHQPRVDEMRLLYDRDKASI